MKFYCLTSLNEIYHLDWNKHTPIYEGMRVSNVSFHSGGILEILTSVEDEWSLTKFWVDFKHPIRGEPYQI